MKHFNQLICELSQNNCQQLFECKVNKSQINKSKYWGKIFKEISLEICQVKIDSIDFLTITSNPSVKFPQ